MVICALLLVLSNMQMSLGLGLTPFVLRVPAIPQLGGLNAAVECFIENHYVRNDASCRIISIATSGLISMCRVLSRLPLGMSALRYADPTLPTITNLPSAAAICAIENIDAIFFLAVLGSVLSPAVNTESGLDFVQGSVAPGVQCR
jgi:hypothetical protein